MAFLVISDYDAIIEREELLDIVDGQPEILDKAERNAEGIAKSHLRKRYDVQAAFVSADDWKVGTQYQPGMRVRTDEWHFIATDISTGMEPGVTAGWEDNWRKDDPRNVVLVELLVRIALCQVIKRVVPAKLGELLGETCSEAREDLKALRDGVIDAELPLLPAEEQETGKMQVISEPKQNWGW